MELTKIERKKAQQHMEKGNVVSIKGKNGIQNYAMCGCCSKVVWLNKPLWRSLHWCVDGVKKITPKLDKSDGLQQKQESSQESSADLGVISGSNIEGSEVNKVTDNEPKRISLRYPKCAFCGERI